jgi:predicted Zn-dependent protease
VLEDGPGYDPIDVLDATYTDDEEREIGLDFDRALIDSPRMIHDPVVTGFLNELGQAIVAQTGPQPFVYRFRVIEDPTLNAFAVFGGYIYFHSGTLLAAGSVDELAGVMGHEIAHVRMRHHARMQKKTHIPDMLSTVAGLAAATVSGEPGAALAAESLNVAMQLHWSREFEAEADHHGVRYTAAAGHDPAGIVRFFERILEARRAFPDITPPYLYSHPEVEDRIAYVQAHAGQLAVEEHSGPDLDALLLDAQTRLAQLVSEDRRSLVEARPQIAGNVIGPLLAAADRAHAAGSHRRALDLLKRASLLEPGDPKVPFRRGEILLETGDPEAAAEAFEQTLTLDSSRAMVFFRLAEVRKAQGDRERAVHAFEQAALRAGANGSLRRRAEWEVEKLTFTLVEAAGFATGHRTDGAATPLGDVVDRYPADAESLVWWGRIGLRFLEHAERMRATWIGPDGQPAAELPLRTYSRPYVGTVWSPETHMARGDWTVEVRLDDDVIDRRVVRLEPR